MSLLDKTINELRSMKDSVVSKINSERQRISAINEKINRINTAINDTQELKNDMNGQKKILRKMTIRNSAYFKGNNESRFTNEFQTEVDMAYNQYITSFDNQIIDALIDARTQLQNQLTDGYGFIDTLSEKLNSITGAISKLFS